MPNENKISHRSWERGWLELIMCQSSKVRPYAVERLAASTYRLTRVVHKLRSGALRRLPHRHRQIVNNSAASKTLSVDKSASLFCIQPEDTHWPATNMHRKQSLDYFNKSFERVPVRSRSINEFSFADAYFNASTIRLSQNGSNACLPTNADQLNTKKKPTPMNPNNQNQSFAAFIGLDKSDKKINVSLQRYGTAKIERSIIKGGAEALHACVASRATQSLAAR